ncbi:MAG: ComEC/Rec2 family competence protein [Cytophagales bacterium]|nr:ComEC/Rec2 family competence protein [Cytophagales bacterium]
MQLHSRQHNTHKENALQTSKGDYLHATVQSLKKGRNSWQATLRELHRSKGSWSKATGQFQVFFSDTSQLKLYDEIVFANRLVPLAANSSNGSYLAYLQSQGIYMQGFVSDFEKTNTAPLQPADYVRRYFFKVFDRYLPAEQAALAKGITVGYKQEISKDTRELYKTAGISHILAVSGLHVGILATLLHFLLQPIRHKRWWCFSVFAIALLAYCALAGFSASVVRASLMFGFYFLSGILHRNTGLANIFFLSMLVHLLIFPADWQSLSFQLSYAAVGSILLALPVINPILKNKHQIVKYILGTFLISFAVQTGTSPLLIYYFGELSLLGCVASLVSIPFAFLLFSGSCLLLMTASVPFIAQYTGYAISYLITAHDTFIHFLSQASWGIVQLDIFTFLSYLGIIITASGTMLALLVKNKRKTGTAIALAGLIQFSAVYLSRPEQQKAPRIIAEIKGDHIFFEPDTSKIILTNYQTSRLGLYYNWVNFYRVKGKKIALIKKKPSSENLKELPPVDFIFVTNNALLYTENLLLKLNALYVIIDSSNSPYSIDKMKKIIPQNGKINYRFINYKGEYFFR